MMKQRGLYVVLGAFAGYALFGTYAAFGFAAIVVNLFTPLPATFVGMRCGPASGWITVALTLLMVMVTGNPSQALMYLIQYGIPAALLPWLFSRGISWDKATVIVLWGMIAAGICGLVIAAMVAGQSPLAMTNALVDTEVAQSTAIMQEMFADADLPVEQRREVSQAVESMANFLQKAYPGIVIAVGGLMTLALIFLLSVLARGRYSVPGRAFPEWKAPEQLVWVLIASGFLVVFTEGTLAAFATNLLVILLPVYFLQGLAVIDCFFRRKAFSPIFRAVGFLLVTVINPLPMVVTGIGVFDLWADFRKPRTPES